MLSKVAVVATAGFASFSADAAVLQLRGANATATGMDKKIPSKGVYESGYNEYGPNVLHKSVETHTDDWLNEQYIGAHAAEEHEDMDDYTARICEKDTAGEHTYAAKNDETEFCTLFLASRGGSFLSHFKSVTRRVIDPKWDEASVQDGSHYAADFAKDDRPNVTGIKPNVQFDYAKAKPSKPKEGPKEGTPPWYKQQCDLVNDQCKMLTDHRLRIAKLDLAHFENDYLRQKRILDSREAHHSDQKADVAAQKKEVARVKALVKKAHITVKADEHCPPELEAAEADLVRLEGIPNHVPADIESECKAQQRVLDAQECVERLREAEAVLAEHQQDLSGEKGDLSGQKKDVAPAAAKLPPQEQRVEDALKAWNIAKARPLSGSIAGIKSTCQAQRDELIAHAGLDLDALRAYWLKQKSILKGKEAQHNEEKGDVVDQKTDVAAQAAQVVQAKKDVEEKAHCPPELEAAEDQLAGLKAIANKKPADIDAECKAENRVLVAKKCVDELRAAEAILEGEHNEHSVERSQLEGEKADVHEAKAALPPQEQKVADARAALDAAMLLIRSLESCRVDK
jgi:hypothetical protein